MPRSCRGRRGRGRLAGRRLHEVHYSEFVGRLDRLGVAHGACLIHAADRVGSLPIGVLHAYPVLMDSHYLSTRY